MALGGAKRQEGVFFEMGVRKFRGQIHYTTPLEATGYSVQQAQIYHVAREQEENPSHKTAALLVFATMVLLGGHEHSPGSDMMLPFQKSQMEGIQDTLPDA